jgi:hypothetical protein
MRDEERKERKKKRREREKRKKAEKNAPMLPVSGALEFVASGAILIAWPITSAQTEYSRFESFPPCAPYWCLLSQRFQRPRDLARSLRRSISLG